MGKQSALLARLSEPTGMFNDNPGRLIESYVFTQLQHYKLNILPLPILLLKYTEASSDQLRLQQYGINYATLHVRNSNEQS
jgi:hypothetical protein